MTGDVVAITLGQPREHRHPGESRDPVLQHAILNHAKRHQNFCEPPSMRVFVDYCCLFILAIALTGCATHMSPLECKNADWYTLGFEDGRKGEPATRIAEYQSNCSAHGVTPDAVPYERGRVEGLDIYCQPENGYKVGLSGENYQGVCPATLAPAFTQRYNVGLKTYRINTQINARYSDIRSYEYELSNLHDKLQHTRNELASGNITDAQRLELTSKLERQASREGQLLERIRSLHDEVSRLQIQAQRK